MRYNLGLMDQYPIEAAGSRIENNPMYRVIFKKPIDPIRLEAAVEKALDVYPLFKTKVVFDKRYYLETNNKPLKIFHVKEENRPLEFGHNTNDYPWQICYYKDKLTFEWLHGVSDGVGAFAFLKQVLCNYFEVKIKGPSQKFLLAPGLEPFFDNKEKGVNYKNDPEGFSIKDFPAYKRGYKTDFYALSTDTKSLLNLAKTCETSLSPIITILFSQALRMHLPKDIKNRKVACNVVMDLRRPLNYETMHNCVEYKRITYLDEYDDMSFKQVAKIYKDILDKGRIPANVVKIITDRVNTFKAYHIFTSKKIIKLILKAIGAILKDIDCNFVVTYLGKANLPRSVASKLANVDFKVWHDFGECIISCIDFNGKFNVNISYNYIEQGVIEDFIALAKKLGINFEIKETGSFEQAHFEE